jgi:putative ABC transport system permease protein
VAQCSGGAGRDAGGGAGVFGAPDQCVGPVSEFSQAVRSVNGQPDLELRATGGFDERLYARVATHPQVALASPVLEVSTYGPPADGQRKPLRVVGVDALVVARVAPALMPMPDDTNDRFALFARQRVFECAAGDAQLLHAAGPLPSHAAAAKVGLQLQRGAVGGQP